MASAKTEIATAIKTQLETLVPASLKTVIIDKIRLLASDFQEWELPAVQVIDLEQGNVHELLRGKETWRLMLEVVIGPTATESPTQIKLWDLTEVIIKKLFETPKLGLAYVVHMKYIGDTTDLHLMEPFYTSKIELTVDYYMHLTGDC